MVFDLTLAQVIFLVYLALVLGVGIIASRFTYLSPADFYIAERTIGTLILGLTFVATILSAFTVFGIGQNAAFAGPATFIFLSLAAVFYTLVFATVGVTLYEVGKDRDVVTPSEYIRARYDSPGLGVLYLVVTGIFMVSLIVAQLFGGGVALDVLMGIPYNLAIILMAGFMLVYIHIAGYRGVVWSDTIQSIVLFGALGGIVAWLLVGNQADSLAVEATEVTPEIFTLLGPIGLWTPLFILTFALAFTFGVPAYPHMIQRYFSAADGFTVRKSGFVFAIIAIPIYFFGIVLGTWSIGIIPDPPNPDHLIPLLVEALFHPVIFGIVMAGAIAAIMSTADSVALTMSSMISRDVYTPYVDPDASPVMQVRITQALLIIIILVALGAAWIRPGTIFQVVEFAVVGLGTTSAPVFLGALWKRSTTSAAAISLVVGPGLLILFEVGIRGIDHPWGIHHGFISLIAAYVSFILISFLTTPPSEQSVAAYSRNLFR